MRSSNPFVSGQVGDKLGLAALILIRDIATAVPKTDEDEFGQTAEQMRDRAQAFLKEHGL